MSPPAHDVYNILPESDVPAQQKLARKAATYVDYSANLDIKSRAARVRLTGVICTIGPATNNPDMLQKMIGNLSMMTFLNLSQSKLRNVVNVNVINNLLERSIY